MNLFVFNMVNWWAVIVATVAGFVIGYIYYIPGVLGNAYIKERGDKNMNNPGITMAISLVLTFITALALEIFIIALGFTTVWLGMLLGAIITAVFVLTNMLSDYLFSGISMKMFFIQGGYRLIMLVVMGAILGAWI